MRKRHVQQGVFGAKAPVFKAEMELENRWLDYGTWVHFDRQDDCDAVAGDKEFKVRVECQ